MCYSLWYNAPTMLPAGGRQHRGCIIPQTVTHSLVLLKMGKIITRNMLSWRIINKLLLLHLVGCLYYLYQWCTVKQISDNEIYLLIKYRVSQDECARPRESVPYVKVYRYNPKHLCSKLNGHGDMAREVWNFDSCYTLIDYQIHIKTGRNMWFL